MIPSPARLLLAAALAGAALAAPSAAQAAGFSQPVVISGSDDALEPVAAMTPDGGTMVVWGHWTGRQRHSKIAYRYAFGRDPEHIGHGQDLRFGDGPVVADDASLYLELTALPSGRFVLCVDRGCTSAAPGEAFGSLRTLTQGTGSWDAVRPDGSVLFFGHEKDSRGHDTLTSTLMAPDGAVGPAHPIERSKGELQLNAAFKTAVADDGTIAMSANTPTGDITAPVRLGLRLMAPGTDTFGPIIAVPGAPLDNQITLTGGPRLTISYGVRADHVLEAPTRQRAIQRLPDGTFGPTLTLPGDPLGIGAGQVVTPPSGAPFAISAGAGYSSKSLCGGPTAGRLIAGPATPEGQAVSQARRISEHGQIALTPQAAVLADGTIVGAWENAINRYGQHRMEVAVRPGGATAFGAGQRLARVGGLGPLRLVAGSSSAALVWDAYSTNPRSNRSQVVLSAYRPAGALAKQAPLPKHPRTGCNEM